jgi:hypothetical protein
MMAHGDARKGKWRGNRRMEWVASTLHTTSERGVSSIITTDAHTSAASCRLNWRPRRFKWTRPFRRKTKSVFCACAITFQTQSTAPKQFIFTTWKAGNLSWFQAFTLLFCILLFWLITRYLNFICRRCGTLCCVAIGRVDKKICFVHTPYDK